MADEEITEEEVQEDQAEDSVEETEEQTSEEQPESGAAEEPESDERQTQWEERFAQQENANRGLLSAVQEERKRRQQLEGRLAQLTELVTAVKDRKPDKPKEEKPSWEDLEVEITDDGRALVKGDKLASLLQTHIESQMKRIEEPIAKVRQDYEQNRQQQEQERAFNQIVNSVLASDDSYREVYPTVQRAADWINKEVIRVQQEAGHEGYMLPEEALEIFAGSAVEAEFQKQFPGLDLERTIRTYNSAWDLKRALHTAASSSQKKAPIKPQLDIEKAKKVMGKPSNLGGVRNQKQVQGTVSLDTLNELTPEDIENMTDAEQEKLFRILEKNDI